MLRWYQKKSIDDLLQWFSDGGEGNPCVVLPTGAGKSHVIAALCKKIISDWPETKILMLTHVKELIEQNAEKMRQHWRGAPMGIYSASVGKKQLGEPITFAGIQSVRKKANFFGHVDLVIIDECHLVGHKNEGGYRSFISELTEKNRHLRVIGFTATPYRLGHGLITDKPAIFDALIEPIKIEQLITEGFLSRLKSKTTSTKFDTSSVHTRGGEYIESELQAAVDTEANNTSVVGEIIRSAGNRKSWLIFCTGVQHAQNIAEILNASGIATGCVTGSLCKTEREKIISDFKSGALQALTNANVLTTGFDHPEIDLIALLRPTMSPALYVQMVGRGTRIKRDTDHCLILDFAGVVETHGPITAVQPPVKRGESKGAAPTKTCPNCSELVAISVKKCGECGFEFPELPKPELFLRDDDIMGMEGREAEVISWRWRVHESANSGKKMLAGSYYFDLSKKPVTEYLCVLHEGYAGTKSIQNLMSICEQSGAKFKKYGEALNDESWLEFFADSLNESSPPKMIEYLTQGKFHQLIKRVW
jgi:DNA repair protein RadD